MKRFVLLSIVAAALGYIVFFIYIPTRNPLSKYGVSYVMETGESPTFNLAHFYWERKGQRIEGPVVVGDSLEVKFKRVQLERGVPDIEISSETDRTHIVVLRLNFDDSSKPEFEIVKSNMLTISYLKMGLIWP